MKYRMAMILLPVVVVAVLLLNLVEGSGDSFLTRGFAEHFSALRGWPVAALARTGEVGARLVEASVLQGDTILHRDLFAGDRPHLVWNPYLLLVDLFLAAVLLAGALLVFLRSRRATGG